MKGTIFPPTQNKREISAGNLTVGARQELLMVDPAEFSRHTRDELKRLEVDEDTLSRLIANLRRGKTRGVGAGGAGGPPDWGPKDKPLVLF